MRRFPAISHGMSHESKSWLLAAFDCNACHLLNSKHRCHVATCLVSFVKSKVGKETKLGVPILKYASILVDLGSIVLYLSRELAPLRALYKQIILCKPFINVKVS